MNTNMPVSFFYACLVCVANRHSPTMTLAAVVTWLQWFSFEELFLSRLTQSALVAPSIGAPAASEKERE